MKVAVLADKATYQHALPGNAQLDDPDVVFLGRTATNDQIVAACPDAEALLFDAIAHIDADLISRLPRLRLLNSEGVGFEGIDLAAATERGVFVCNNPGGNAGAVAEQTVLLMLALLRRLVTGDAAVRAGQQMKVKVSALQTGWVHDLADCTVGLLGIGSIAQATAKRLAAFGTRVLYWSRHRRSPDQEAALGLTYASLDDLLAQSDIVSVHLASTPQTRGLVDGAFLAKMKPTAYLVNTSRGELVDSAALAAALEAGTIAGAGLDTVAPEPVLADNPLLNMGEEAASHVVFSPHIGGITQGSMRRMQEHMWDNVARVARGERPDGIVNGL